MVTKDKPKTETPETPPVAAFVVEEEIERFPIRKTDYTAEYSLLQGLTDGKVRKIKVTIPVRLFKRRINAVAADLGRKVRYELGDAEGVVYLAWAKTKAAKTPAA